MKKYSLVLLFLTFPFSILFSQTIEDKELELLKKDILVYRIFILGKSKEFVYLNPNSLLPDYDSSLKLDYEISGANFIDKSYTIFEITNPDYTFEITNPDYTLKRRSLYKGNTYYVPFSRRLLIAKKGKEIIKLSGAFFKDPIADFYNLNNNQPESFYDFIKIKLYNYSLSGIKFKKKTKNKLFFEAHFPSEIDIYVIEVNKNNHDDISIYYKNLKNLKIIYLR